MYLDPRVNVSLLVQLAQLHEHSQDKLIHRHSVSLVELFQLHQCLLALGELRDLFELHKLFMQRAKVAKGKEQQRGGEHDVNTEHNVGAAGFQVHVSVTNRSRSLDREVQALDECPIFHAAEDSRRDEEKYDNEADGA